jgi:hypothetical protein
MVPVRKRPIEETSIREIEFGRPRAVERLVERFSARRWWVFGAVGLVAVVVNVVGIGTRRRAPTPEVESTGAVVYLANGSPAQPAVRVRDLDRGTERTIELGQDIGWFVRTVDGVAGTYVDGGVPMLLGPAGARVVYSDSRCGVDCAPLGRIAPGPAGQVWLRENDPFPLVALHDVYGHRSATSFYVPDGVDLIGSSADDHAVVRRPDHLSYVLADNGAFVPLAAGPTSAVEHGRFVEKSCDAAQHCTFVGHAGLVTRSLGPVVEGTSFRFQPDGTVVAMVPPARGRMTLIDLSTGARVSVGLRPGSELSGPQPDAVGAPLASQVAFLPGHEGLVVQPDGGRLAIVGLDGKVRTVTRLDSRGYLLGVGRAANPTT